MIRLLRVEVERSLRRRMVWALVAIAVVGIALLGVVAFTSSTRLDPAHPGEDGNPALVRTWWTDDGADSPLAVGAVFLLLGGLIGGAGVVGGEWRTGNLATVLTWEPRRLRLLAARLIACAACAFAIGVVLQGLLLASLVPAVLAHGTAAGADRAMAAALALGLVRIAALTAAAALLGACGAWATRSTAVSIVGLGAWFALVEPIVRARRPGAGTWLVGESLTRILIWDDLGPGPSAHVGPVHATLLVAALVTGLVTLAAVTFVRGDATAT